MTGKIFVGLTLILFFVMVFLNNSLASKGRDVDSLMGQKGALESQLLDLDNQIAQVSSLNTVRGEAVKLGMVPGKLRVLPPPPVALAPSNR